MLRPEETWSQFPPSDMTPFYLAPLRADTMMRCDPTRADVTQYPYTVVNEMHVTGITIHRGVVTFKSTHFTPVVTAPGSG